LNHKRILQNGDTLLYSATIAFAKPVT